MFRNKWKEKYLNLKDKYISMVDSYHALQKNYDELVKDYKLSEAQLDEYKSRSNKIRASSIRQLCTAEAGRTRTYNFELADSPIGVARESKKSSKGIDASPYKWISYEAATDWSI